MCVEQLYQVPDWLHQNIKRSRRRIHNLQPRALRSNRAWRFVPLWPAFSAHLSALWIGLLVLGACHVKQLLPGQVWKDVWENAGESAHLKIEGVEAQA